ncbi:MAG: femAB family protein [uncultured bacterium]|nr:MAG: femAB family protein [uncultured bacterium]KKR17589.1 MAG: FemAB family protein [Candidatus Levybacteria bacterium GW2011_GWA1_39_32]KKR51473.1 MAG: FemAB family protein [Candidatus Levybacteria bacterium GW2011_GWC1_40_19]KKR73574.1 MAG: FemAB family protein [Candidatus Levybacteria bacterium GW2011_GWC2_40_7]KKR95462.1 MAG: FemAB family protein [Candidatus Levybacteria bacterium GW2011_GWA2_41_15]KKS01948.1 MAG: FemAB family protein [Candidatus Levybacteria bacterium GW2011_GWB1_41_2
MIDEKIDRMAFNSFVSHPLQAYEWGEFREKTGIKVVRETIGNQAFQLTIHKVPFFKTGIGYLPKGEAPNENLLSKLKEIGKEENCAYIQLEPNVEIGNWKLLAPRSLGEAGKIGNLGLKPSFHPLFTKYTFVLDLTLSEEELLKGMHHKTRYNIKVAQKYGVRVIKDDSENAFKEYLRLASETTKRKGFYAHDKDYHTKMWQTLKASGFDPEKLQAHLLTALYEQKTLASWILFSFKDTLYYPYGASSSENREVMASNLMMWEAIRFGKNLGLKKLDMWGSLGATPDPKDPWYGFHRFKQGYGPDLIEFAGSFDLVINPLIYKTLRLADKARWTYLKLRKSGGIKS